MLSHYRISVITLMASVFCLTATASTISFVPEEGGYWNFASNWDLYRLPQSGDHVLITSTSPSWNKIVTYNSISGNVYESISINSTSSTYGMLFQDSHALESNTIFVGSSGLAYLWMEDYAYAKVNDHVYIGVNGGAGEGWLFLSTIGDIESGSGLEIGGALYVGYSGNGEVDHRLGEIKADQVYMGMGGTSNYSLSGSETGSKLSVNYNLVVGNTSNAEFEQHGGTIDVDGSLYLGLNGAKGEYQLKGGAAHFGNLSIGMNDSGKGELIQSGGSMTVDTNLTIGAMAEHSWPARLEVNDDIEEPETTVSGNVSVGQFHSATLLLEGGDFLIGGNLTIHSEGDAWVIENNRSLLVQGKIENHNIVCLESGTITSPEFINDQTNVTSGSTTISHTAELYTRTFHNKNGSVFLAGDALIRGPLAIPPHTYFVCNFINDDYFKMEAIPGNCRFYGQLTNNGLFRYGYSADFSSGILINNGTVDLQYPFTCNQLINNTSMAIEADTPVTVDTSYAYAVENNGDMIIENGAELEVINGPFINNGNLYAGGLSSSPYTHINGDVEHNGLLVPSADDSPGIFRVHGDFTANPGSEILIRINGNTPNDYDLLWIVGDGQFDGDMTVVFQPGYTPQPNDYYVVLVHSGSPTGFGTLNLPPLPDGLHWRVNLNSSILGLEVHADSPCDINGDHEVDLDDFDGFADCMYGPNYLVPRFCAPYNFDGDLDVDLQDFALFQDSLTTNLSPLYSASTVLIPEGEFQMGDSFEEHSGSELPVHAVDLDGYYIFPHEVTLQQYTRGLNWALSKGLIEVVDGVVYQAGSEASTAYCTTSASDPILFFHWDGERFSCTSPRKNHPIISITWYGAAAYANWRSMIEGKTPAFNLATWECDFSANGYRLPTEAEWEKAARGGSPNHRFSWSHTDTIEHALANYLSSSDYTYDVSPTRGEHPTFASGSRPSTNPVDYFSPNDYGLHGMAGNVREWCYDWFDTYYYSSSPNENPLGPSYGTRRVTRGGCYWSNASFCRNAARGSYPPGDTAPLVGFRLVRTAD